MSLRFDPYTQSLLEPVPSAGKLKFRSSKTGSMYDASPEHTLLASGDVGEVDILSKYKNTIATTAFDPTNPSLILDDGCPQCQRKIVSYQRLGPNKTVILVCLCGHTWI